MVQNKTQKQKVIEQFTKIEGIGKAKAEILYNGGYKNLEKLKKASVDELVKIKGIGKSYAEKIYKNLRAREKEEIEEESWEKYEEKKTIPNVGGIFGKITETTRSVISKTLGTVNKILKREKKTEEEKKGVTISETPKKPAPPMVKKAPSKKSKASIIKEFTSIPGIGASKAESLYNAGFRSISELRKTSLKKLSEVKGIGEVKAKKIKEELRKK